MEVRCIEAEQIGDVLEFPDDHPVRRHADTCPRCRSLVASYRSFMDAGPVEGSDVGRARDALDKRIRAAASHWKPAMAPGRSFRWQALLRPAPLLAAGLVVVAAAVFWTSRGPEEGSLRDSAPEVQSFALNAAEVLPNGSIHLSWSARTGADQYHVRIYGPDFSEVYRSASTADTSLDIDRSALPANLPPTLDLTWRVFALSQGDVIATSAPGSIRTR